MPKKVMVVDDEEEMLEFIKTGLEINGYDVIATSDARKSIQLACKEKPDIIVLDFVMPGIDGYTIYTGLSASEITKDIPVIFMSGNFITEVRGKISQSKAYFFILKPFEMSELLARIKDCLTIHPSKE